MGKNSYFLGVFCLFFADMGSALSGSDCGFKWSHVQRLCGAYSFPGSYSAPYCAPISY